MAFFGVKGVSKAGVGIPEDSLVEVELSLSLFPAAPVGSLRLTSHRLFSRHQRLSWEGHMQGVGGAQIQTWLSV